MKFNSLIPIIVILALFACHPDKEKVVDRNKPEFTSNDASRLFFKNVRILYYDFEEQNEGKIQVLTLKKREKNNELAEIYVDIVNNWHQDRAFPLITFSSLFDSLDNLEIEVRNGDEVIESLNFTRQSNMIEQYSFASAIYEAILMNHTFYAPQIGMTVLEDENNREAFRISMVDFYRLVRVY